MAEYAHANDAYKELRDMLGPWTAADGFQQWPGTVAGWSKAVDPERLLRFKFEGASRMGDSDMGHALAGLVQLDPAPGGPAATPIRQSAFSTCLVGGELEQLAAIQGAINRRRPPLPAGFAEDFRADSLLGHFLRGLYEPSPKYQEGEHVSLSYYAIDDVREWARFIAGVLPAVLDRFLAGRTPRPIDTTPPHLKPRWLGGTRR